MDSIAKAVYDQNEQYRKHFRVISENLHQGLVLWLILLERYLLIINILYEKPTKKDRQKTCNCDANEIDIGTEQSESECCNEAG